MTEPINNTSSSSHDYAQHLRELAEFLLARPSFRLPYFNPTSYHFFRYHDKEPFVEAVKALGSGKKKITEDSIEFMVYMPGTQIGIEAPRNLFCRLIRPAEFECDPFLSPEEEKNLGGAA